MMRISVDFPQPDGPTSVRNSPSATARSMPPSTGVAPNDFAMRLELDGRHGSRLPLRSQAASRGG